MHDSLLDYDLIDMGNGYRLERFGNNTIERPDNTASGQPDSNEWSLDARCIPAQGKYEWQFEPTFSKPWQILYGDLKLSLRATVSKNIGLFPEQEANWRWIRDTVRSAKTPLRVLNLFAYTGVASLVAANEGAQVCHVDASKSVIAWAKENQLSSGLGDKPIRWIVDDALKFVEREKRRQVFYDGIILDPPAFGLSEKRQFKFEKHIQELLRACKRILAGEHQFVLLNCYATGLSPEDAKQLLRAEFPSAPIECGELAVMSTGKKHRLSCSVYARFRKSS